MGTVFQASGLWKGRDFTGWSIWKCRVIISVRKKAQKGSQIYSKAVKKSGKRSGFVIYSYFKCSAFTLVERDAKFYISYKKGVSFVKKRRRKEVIFQSKWYLNGIIFKWYLKAG